MHRFSLKSTKPESLGVTQVARLPQHLLCQEASSSLRVSSLLRPWHCDSPKHDCCVLTDIQCWSGGCSTLNIEVMTPPRTRSQRKRSVRSSEDSEDVYPASKQTGAIEGVLQPQSSTPTNASQHKSNASQLATLRQVSSLPSPQLQTPPVSHQAESASTPLNPAVPQPSCRPQFYAFAHPLSEHQAESLPPGLSQPRVNSHLQSGPVTDTQHLSQNKASHASESQSALNIETHVKAEPHSGPITTSHPQATSQDAAQPSLVLHAQPPPQPDPQQNPTQSQQTPAQPQQTQSQLQPRSQPQPSNQFQHEHPPQSSAAPKSAAQAPAAPTPAAPTPLSAQQDTYPVLLQLDACMAPALSLPLAKHKPGSAVIKFWRANHQNPALYSLRLIGDAQQPGESVGIGTQDLMIHSAWAASILPTTDTNRPVSPHGVDTLLPVKTPASVVSKMVESLHSGTISLSHDNVEHMLMLSHAMKVRTFFSQPGQLTKIIWWSIFSGFISSVSFDVCHHHHLLVTWP